jgi:hypothetical protein
MSSEQGFAFERRIDFILKQIKSNLESGWTFEIKGEQEIRDHFKEQSLNGVDHMIQIKKPTGEQHVFLLQEKWKLITNQREVSQFLDCCARILARMPSYEGQVHRMWVSRTVPSLNGEKSLQEGCRKVDEALKMYHSLGITDRGLVWNTDLIEALELENLLCK